MRIFDRHILGARSLIRNTRRGVVGAHALDGRWDLAAAGNLGQPRELRPHSHFQRAPNIGESRPHPESDVLDWPAASEAEHHLQRENAIAQIRTIPLSVVGAPAAEVESAGETFSHRQPPSLFRSGSERRQMITNCMPPVRRRNARDTVSLVGLAPGHFVQSENYSNSLLRTRRSAAASAPAFPTGCQVFALSIAAATEISLRPLAGTPGRLRPPNEMEGGGRHGRRSTADPSRASTRRTLQDVVSEQKHLAYQAFETATSSIANAITVPSGLGDHL